MYVSNHQSATAATTTLTSGKANSSILADMIGMILIMESNIFPCPKEKKKVRDKELVVAESEN